MFTKEEIKVLKYIKRHPGVTRSKLLKKFPYSFDLDCKISDFIYCKNMQEIMDGELHTGEYEATNFSTYYVNRNAKLYFAERAEKRFLFWLPYGITTFIALLSLIAQIISFI